MKFVFDASTYKLHKSNNQLASKASIYFIVNVTAHDVTVRRKWRKSYHQKVRIIFNLDKVQTNKRNKNRKNKSAKEGNKEEELWTEWNEILSQLTNWQIRWITRVPGADASASSFSPFCCSEHIEYTLLYVQLCKQSFSARLGTFRRSTGAKSDNSPSDEIELVVYA